jgi:hypothetical protein
VELADVEFRLRQNPLGVGQWIIFGRRASSYLSRNLRPRIGSGLRLYGDLFGASPYAADLRSEAGDAESDPGVFFQPIANAFHALSSI